MGEESRHRWETVCLDIRTFFGVTLNICTSAEALEHTSADLAGPAPHVAGTTGNTWMTTYREHSYRVCVITVIADHHQTWPDLVRTITHEAHHAAEMTLDSIGEGRTKELHAYLAGWLAECVTDACIKSGWTPTKETPNDRA